MTCCRLKPFFCLCSSSFSGRDSCIAHMPRWFRLVFISANFKFRKVALVPGIEYAIMVISYAYATSLVEFTNNILFVLMGILQNTCSKTVLKRVGVRPLPCFKPEFPLKLCVNSLWIFYGIICCLVSSFVLAWVKFASHVLCYLICCNPYSLSISVAYQC